MSKTRVVVLLVATCVLAGCSGPTSTASPGAARQKANGPDTNRQGTNGVGGTASGRSGPGAGGLAPAAPDGASTGGTATGPTSKVGTSQFGPEISAAQDQQSTFALDVDSGSYTYARTLLGEGQLPNRATVRPEEFINSFVQDYPQPDGSGFTVTLDGSAMPASFASGQSEDMRLLRVGLQTMPEADTQRPSAALTFVIDTSGSMGDPGKLDLVKDALHTLVDELRPTDSVAIVTFNSSSHVLQSMTPVTRRAELHNAIDRLAAGGHTNLESGLVTGYQVARDGFRPGATNRVVLLSDGLANTGDTQASPLLSQVRAAADKQITLLGVGVGNDYGDALMEQLADHGDGFVVYVSDQQRARSVFVQQLPATLSLRALDAKAQVTFSPATVATYRLIGYDDRALADSSFRNDHVDGGEVGAGHTVTALYAVRLQPDASGEVAIADVRWLDPVTRGPSEATNTVYVTDLDVPFEYASPRLQVCYAAGYFAEVLRHSPYGQQVQLPDLAEIAANAAYQTEDHTVAELAAMIRRAKNLLHPAE